MQFLPLSQLVAWHYQDFELTNVQKYQYQRMKEFFIINLWQISIKFLFEHECVNPKQYYLMLVQPCILSRLASFFVEKCGTSNQKRKFNCVFFLRWWNILYNSKLRFLKIQHGQKKGWRWISINLFLLNKRKYYKVSNKKSQVLNLIDRDFEKKLLFLFAKIYYTLLTGF